MPPKGRRGRGRGVATLKTVELGVEERSKGPASLSAEDSDGSSASSSIKRAKKTKEVVNGQYLWKDEDQHVMSGFWMSNTIFYDKTQRDCKNKELKKQKIMYIYIYHIYVCVCKLSNIIDCNISSLVTFSSNMG